MPGLLKEIPTFREILHCLLHCGVLIPFLLWQNEIDLFLYTVELLFFGIRERRVGFQRELAGVPDHGKLLV